VLVVVDVVPRVAVVAVDVVQVVVVGHRAVPAAGLVDVHVPGMRNVAGRRSRGAFDLVDVVLVDVVDVAVVQEVDVVVVRDGGVPAEPVVDVLVLPEGVVGGGVGHQVLRRHGSPNADGPQTMVMP